jgi:hypothetical protein
VTTAQRLTKVEAALSPKQLVLRWLEEAQRYTDMGAYLDSLIDAPSSTWPMDRLVHEARDSAQTSSRGTPRADAEKAVRRSMIQAAFLFQLVLGINVRTQDILDRERLIHAALTAQLALFANVPNAPLEGSPLSRLVLARDLLLQRVDKLHAFETARSRIELRYFDGARVDFRAAREAWSLQLRLARESAVLAIRAAELDGADPPAKPDSALFEARVTKLAADLVEPAKAKAYNELGDGRNGHAIAVAWLATWVRTQIAQTAAGSGRTL